MKNTTFVIVCLLISGMALAQAKVDTEACVKNAMNNISKEGKIVAENLVRDSQSIVVESAPVTSKTIKAEHQIDAETAAIEVNRVPHKVT